MRTLNRRTKRIPLLPAALAVAISTTALAAGPATSMTDPDVTTAVTTELFTDQGIDGYRLDVMTNDGIVTLTGTVNNLLARDRALAIVRTVKGVRSVVDRIEVNVPDRETSRLRTDVRTRLALDPVTESWDIDVDVSSDQVVTLTGTVDSWPERRFAGTIARGILGVKSVENRLVVQYDGSRADSEIATEIRRKLEWNNRINDRHLNVAVENGRVTLRGRVGSAAERHLAARAAWIAGVRSVNDDAVTVSFADQDDWLRDKKAMIKPDAEVRKAVNDAMMFDPRVLSTNVDVAVDDGVVTLSGKVDNVRARRAAVADARNTMGVWRVKDQIRVRPSTPTDATIENRIGADLLLNPYVDRYEITVDVADGRATLRGTVDTFFEKAEADTVAASVYGVTHVDNNLLVEDDYDVLTFDPYLDDWYVYDYDWYTMPVVTSTKSDWEIHEDVRDELWWSPFVDADEVTVTVNRGVATLTGTVDTWSERRSATENALEGGAIAVDNDLLVDFGPDYYSP